MAPVTCDGLRARSILRSIHATIVWATEKPQMFSMFTLRWDPIVCQSWAPVIVLDTPGHIITVSDTTWHTEAIFFWIKWVNHSLYLNCWLFTGESIHFICVMLQPKLKIIEWKNVWNISTSPLAGVHYLLSQTLDNQLVKTHRKNWRAPPPVPWSPKRDGRMAECLQMKDKIADMTERRPPPPAYIICIHSPWLVTLTTSWTLGHLDIVCHKQGLRLL